MESLSIIFLSKISRKELEYTYIVSRNIIKAHILTGCDQISNVRTKHASLFSDLAPAVSMFAENPTISDLYISEG